MTPTAAKVVEFELCGETRKLFLGLRTFKALDINPFDPKALEEFFSTLDIDRAIKLVEESLISAERKLKISGNRLPADDILDDLDLIAFKSILDQSFSMDEDEGVAEDADPQTASVG